METATRRSMLRGGLLLAGGAIGLTAGRTVAARADSAGNGSSSGQSVTLGGTGLTLRAISGEVTAPAVGDSLLAQGVLVDSGGNVLGEFHGVCNIVQVLGGDGDDLASNEQHTFVLSNGTINGSGLSDPFTGAGTFAIVGGTGQYAGARGTYTAQQDPLDAGGDGTATFTFNLAQ